MICDLGGEISLYQALGAEGNQTGTTPVCMRLSTLKMSRYLALGLILSVPLLWIFVDFVILGLFWNKAMGSKHQDCKRNGGFFG